jgi:hypothetical protein
VVRNGAAAFRSLRKQAQVHGCVDVAR